jgi:hypothetical protein
MIECRKWWELKLNIEKGAKRVSKHEGGGGAHFFGEW